MALFPQWFLAPDIVIDFFSFIVLFTFVIISLRYYQLSRNKKFLYFGFAFLLISLGELSRIILYLSVYLNLSTTYRIGIVLISSNIVSSVDVLYFAGSFIYRSLIMLGFYLIYYTTKRKGTRLEHLIVFYFILIVSLFTTNEAYNIFNLIERAYHIFNLTIIAFLFVIVVNYVKLYQERKSQNTKILISGFFILLISYIMMIFARRDTNIYMAANIMQLISYILFLCIIIRIYKYGKEK